MSFTAAQLCFVLNHAVSPLLYCSASKEVAKIREVNPGIFRGTNLKAQFKYSDVVSLLD